MFKGQRERAWLALATIALGGCSAFGNVRSQAITPATADLAGIEGTLLGLDVEIVSQGGAIELERLFLQDVETEESFPLALFRNAILGSSRLAYQQDGDRLTSTVLVDLPPGVYALTEIDFVGRSAGSPLSPSTRGTLEHSVQEPIHIAVLEGNVTYAGKLTFTLGDLRVTAESPNASTVAAATFEDEAPLGVVMSQQINQKLGGRVTITAVPPDSSGTARLKAEYPALSQVRIELAPVRTPDP